MAEELDIPMPSMMPAGAAAWRTSRRREGLDTTTRRLVLFAGVIGGGLLLLVAAWSLTGHRAAGVPVIEPDSRPLRTKPENAGGMQLAGGDDAILSGASGGQDGMAPPPETPAPQDLAVQAPTPQAAPPAVAPAAPQAVSQTPEPPPPPAAAPARPSVATPPVVRAETGTQVQLAALVSEEQARTEWQRLLRKMPDLLGGRSPVVTRIDRADGKVFFRLRTGGFADIAQATAFCAKIRAKGGACTLG